MVLLYLYTFVKTVGKHEVAVALTQSPQPSTLMEKKQKTNQQQKFNQEIKSKGLIKLSLCMFMLVSKFEFPK